MKMNNKPVGLDVSALWTANRLFRLQGSCLSGVLGGCRFLLKVWRWRDIIRVKHDSISVRGFACFQQVVKIC